MTDHLTLTNPVHGLAVTAQSVPDMTVAVAAGYALVDSQSTAATAGNLTIAVADPVRDRIDAIVVDSAGTKSVIQGTIYDGVNVQPPDTTGYAVAAYVYVLGQTHPQYTGTITSSAIIDARDFTLLPQVAQTFAYTFDTGTSNADPGSAKFRFNGTTWAGITAMYLSDQSASSPLTGYGGPRAWLQNTPRPFLVRIWSRKAPDNWWLVKVTAYTSHTNYFELTISDVADHSNHGLAGPNFDTDAFDVIFEYISADTTALTATNATANNTGDVTMTSANTFYDGVSLASSIGGSGQTYLLNAYITVIAGGAGAFVTARIWDGSTTVAEGMNAGGATNAVTVSLHAIVTPGSATTYKVSAASTSASGTIKQNPTANSSGANVATRISYVRIA